MKKGAFHVANPAISPLLPVAFMFTPVIAGTEAISSSVLNPNGTVHRIGVEPSPRLTTRITE